MAESSGGGILCVGVGAETGLEDESIEQVPAAVGLRRRPVWAAEVQIAQGRRRDLELQKAHQDLWAWR